jgi:hypothetical protein
MVYIYILELETNKYYIGKSNTPDIRIENHFTQENGSEFTKKYKPIKMIEIISDCDDYDEDKYTLKYMDNYGINNVRGGSFSQIELSEDNVKIINKMINGAKNQCFICGSKSHFVKNCDKKNEVKIKFVDGKCDCVSSYLSPHRKSKCALKKIFNIFDIFTNMESDEDDDKPFYDNHEFTTKDNKKKKYKGCYRCGRIGHYATSCYAKKDINGKNIY